MALDAGVVDIERRLDASQPLAARPLSHRRLPRQAALAERAGGDRVLVQHRRRQDGRRRSAARAQHAYFERFGLLDRHPIRLPEVGLPQQPAPWRPINTVTAAYGHGLAVSPLQVADAVAATVCGAPRPRAHLVAEERAAGWAQPPVSAETAAKLRWLMWLTVTEGTGTLAKVPGYLVGGKTGSADKPGRGGYRGGGLIASFVAAFPIDRPRYVVLVTFDEPKGDAETYGQAHGGWTAAPTVGADHQPDRPAARPAAGRSAAPSCGSASGWSRARRINGRTGRLEPSFAAAPGVSWRRRRGGEPACGCRALLDPGVTLEGAAGRDVEITGPRRQFAHGRSRARCSRRCRQPDRRPPLRRRGDRARRGRGARRRAAAAATSACRWSSTREPRRRLALIAARFYGKQPRCIVAVTGTSGKTSVAGFARQLWSASRPSGGLARHARPDRAGRRSAPPASPPPTRCACTRCSPSSPRRRRSSGARGLEPRPRPAPSRRRAHSCRGVYQSLTRPLRLSRRPRRLSGGQAAPVRRAAARPGEPPCSTPISREFATARRGLPRARHRRARLRPQGAPRLRLVARRAARRPGARARPRRPRERSRDAAGRRLPGGEPARGARPRRRDRRRARGGARGCSAASRAPPAGCSRSAAIPAARRCSSTTPTSPMRSTQVLRRAAPAHRGPPRRGVRLRRRSRSAASGR